MSNLFLLALAMLSFSGSVSFAQVGGVIEGRLVQKLEGELDPVILGDGCVAVVEYYREGKGMVKIAIYQPEGFGPCFTAGAEVNEEFDFKPASLKKITHPLDLSAIRDLVTRQLKVKNVSGFYSMKPARKF